jgi:hypothetical protein
MVIHMIRYIHGGHKISFSEALPMYMITVGEAAEKLGRIIISSNKDFWTIEIGLFKQLS